MKRNKPSKHALAAKMIKQILKKHFPKIKFNIRSKSYSGGSSVHIKWIDGPSESEVRKLVKDFEYGYFDGMTDTYIVDNYREDIPQVKYVLLERRLSDKAILEAIKKYGFRNVKKEDLDRTNKKLFEQFKAWTLRELGWRELYDKSLL